MNTCGTCKFFGKQIVDDGWDGYSPEGQTRFHKCELIRQLNKYDEDRRAKESDVAVTMDGSGYFAALCVSEEFGCNQWQEKP